MVVRIPSVIGWSTAIEPVPQIFPVYSVIRGQNATKPLKGPQGDDCSSCRSERVLAICSKPGGPRAVEQGVAGPNPVSPTIRPGNPADFRA